MISSYISTFLISMVPLIELRGAIPYAVHAGIPAYQAIIIAVIGNMIPVPFIYLFARRILEWGKDKAVIGGFFTWCINKGEKASRVLHSDGRGVFIALALFVGIPLPGTGAWTGVLGASFLNLGFKKSTAAVLSGVLLAGAIMTIVSLCFASVFNAFVG